MSRNSFVSSVQSIVRYRPACVHERFLCLLPVAILYAVFDRDYKRQLRGRWEETWAAYSWWREQAPPSKQGTLNAVLARRYGESQGDCCTKSGTCLKRYALRSMLCSVGSSSIRCVLCNIVQLLSCNCRLHCAVAVRNV